jgi:hypothetical protein
MPIFIPSRISRQLLPFSGGNCGTWAVAAVIGEAGSSSGMISWDDACLPLAADLVSAESVG